MHKIVDGKLVLSTNGIRRIIEYILGTAIIIVVLTSSDQIRGLALYIVISVCLLIGLGLILWRRVTNKMIINHERIEHYESYGGAEVAPTIYYWRDIASIVRYEITRGRHVKVRTFIRTKQGDEVRLVADPPFIGWENDKKEYKALKEYISSFAKLESVEVDLTPRSVVRILVPKDRVISEERVVLLSSKSNR